MPHCSACSTYFQSLASAICGRCKVLPSKPNAAAWGQCDDCSLLYEHLSLKRCGYCSRKNLGSDNTSSAAVGVTDETAEAHPAITHAMNNSVNPRTFNENGRVPYANPYVEPRDPLQAIDSNRETHLRTEARRIMTAVGDSYVNAVSRAAPGVIVSRSRAKLNIKTSATVGSATGSARYTVVVRKVINGNNERLRVTPYTPTQLGPYMAKNTYGELIEDVRQILDKLYCDLYHHEIQSSSQFVLAYSKGGVGLPRFDHTYSMAKVWADSIQLPGVNITEADRKVFRLDLMVNVDYPLKVPMVQVDSDDEDEFLPSKHKTRATRSTAIKRTRAPSMASEIGNSRPFKKPSRAGGAAYITSIENSVSEMTYTVIKTTCRLGEGNQIRWNRSATFLIDVQDEKFASGKTKDAYKICMRIDDSAVDQLVYAGKRFYNIGKGKSIHRVTNSDNNGHLRLELVVATLADQCLKRFNELKAAKSAYTSKIMVAESFLLTVSEGVEKGLSWIVNPYFGDSSVTKYSGTDQAGCNTDLDGMTCDAFAHFSLYDSDCSVVFVDIQGIRQSPQLTGGNTASGRPTVFLFDLMAHSAEMSMGLGDQGPAGIRQFCNQHKCNQICVALGLETIDTSEMTFKDRDIEGLNNNDEPDGADTRPQHHRSSYESETFHGANQNDEPANKESVESNSERALDRSAEPASPEPEDLD